MSTGFQFDEHYLWHVAVLHALVMPVGAACSRRTAPATRNLLMPSGG